MPSVSRLNLSSCREGCSGAACKRCACLGAAELGALGFLSISRAGASRASVVSLQVMRQPMTQAQGDEDFSLGWHPSPRNRAATPHVLEAV